jgi:hypothetical protein
LSVRLTASSKSGLWAAAMSAMPFANRLTVSTPRDRKTSPSPALIAWNAMRVVCRLEEQ